MNRWRTDLEKRGERARQANRWRERGKRFGSELENFVRFVLLGGNAERGAFVELNDAAFSQGTGFWKEQKCGVTDRNLVAKSEETFGYRDAIDEGAGRSVKVSEKEAGGLFHDRTMLGRYGQVLQLNRIAWIAADG